MDTLLPQLLSFPPQPPLRTENEYDSHIRLYLEGLSKIPAKKLTLDVTEGEDLLDVLNPAINSLPYLHGLLAHISKPSKGKQTASSAASELRPDTRLWERVLHFLQYFDPIQIRYAGGEFRRLLQNIELGAIASSKIEEAVLPLSTALRRLDPSGVTLTSIHLMFARASLAARQLEEAKTVLDHRIHYFPTTSEKSSANLLHQFPCSLHDISSTFITLKSGLTEKLDYRDHLKYHLYGAIIYIAMHEWDKALLFLEIVLFTPTTNTASFIQVEAYRKWLLVCLISRGKRGRLPPSTSQQAIRLYHSLSRAYDAVAQLFEDGLSRHENISRLLQECQVGQQLWREDSNTGLMQYVLDAYRRFSVIRLGGVFACLPMSDVHKTIAQGQEEEEREGPDETRQYVSDMITTGQLNARLEEPRNGVEGMILRFLRSTSRPAALETEEPSKFVELTAQMQRINAISNEARSFERELGLSKECIHSVRKERAAAANGDANGMQDIMGGQDAMIDEDMMADL